MQTHWVGLQNTAYIRFSFPTSLSNRYIFSFCQHIFNWAYSASHSRSDPQLNDPTGSKSACSIDYPFPTKVCRPEVDRCMLSFRMNWSATAVVHKPSTSRSSGWKVVARSLDKGTSLVMNKENNQHCTECTCCFCLHKRCPVLTRKGYLLSKDSFLS